MFLTRNETEVMLKGELAGTFLIRISGTQPGSFCLSFNSQNQDDIVPVHILITCCGEEGYMVVEQDSQTTRKFETLLELIDHYSLFLNYPLINPIPFEPWFVGDCSGSEAQEALNGQPIGTFLVRFSSTQVGAFAISFVNNEEAISHSLIEHLTSGEYKITSEGKPYLFPTINEVLDFHSDTLLYPINERHFAAFQTIQTWKNDRTKKNKINGKSQSIS